MASKTLQEFKEFISKGNVLDMAVGVIIGGAFGKIVSSLVEDIIMPLVSGLLGKADFKDLSVTLGDGSVLKYGSFIQNIVDFLIIAFVIFIFVKKVMSFTSRFKKEEEAVATTKICQFCKSEIPIDATRCPNCTSQL